MRFKFLSIASILIMAGLFSGCSDDDLEVSGASEGTSVNFTLSDLGTRTIYDSNDQFQINWLDGDKVSIFCAQTQPGKADYTVLKDAQIQHKGKLEPNSNGLKWGTPTTPHDFYAVYPADPTRTDPASINDANPQIIRFKVNRNQLCTLKVMEDGTPDGGTDGQYVAEPDMNNAYMVAHTRTAGAVDQVDLAFKPIMTTLKIVIRGRNPKDLNAPDTSRITGISIIRENVTSQEAKQGWFSYDLANDIIVMDPNQAQPSTETTFIGLKNPKSPNTSYVDLLDGQTLTVTAFFPPMPAEAAAKLKVRVHGTGQASLTTTLGTGVAPRSKASITLPYIVSQKGNNWITPLDGNIYVSQLSIPGSHDAATGEDMNTIIGKFFATTQGLKLHQQWDLGIRCFDLRAAIYKQKPINELWIYHGMTRTKCSWRNAIDMLRTKLTENPGEFAVVLLRHENEGTLYKVTDTTTFYSFMKTSLNSYGDLFIKWKPDLTIDEARGHIIMISREWGGWPQGAFTHFPDNKDLTDPAILADQTNYIKTIQNADGSQWGLLYIQDYYNSTSYDKKTGCIQKMLEFASDFHVNEAKKNYWMINHASGYKNVTGSQTYRNNAVHQNNKICEMLKTRTGTTGIIMMDYAGEKSNTGLFIPSNVNGDILLQAIINNNYTYRMKRKGE